MAGAGHHLYTAGPNTGLAFSGQISALQDHHQHTDIRRLGAATAQFDHLLPPTAAALRPPHHPTSSPFFLPNFHHDVNHNTTALIQTKPFSGGLLPLPDTAGSSSSTSSAGAAAGAGLFNLGFFSNNNSNNSMIADQLGNGCGAEAPARLFSGGTMIDTDGGGHGQIPPLYNEPSLPQMSATALLQKAAQMGATTSGNGGTFLRAFGSSSSSSNKSEWPPVVSFLPATMRSQMETDNHLQDLMNSLASGGSDGLTRDFLGVGGIMRGCIGGEHGGGHHGIDMSSLDGDMKSKSGGMRPSFGGGSLL